MAAAVAEAVEELPRLGPGGGKAKWGRGLKPEPQRGGSWGRQSGKHSCGCKRAESGARWVSSAFTWPAGAPEMHLHQVLTRAVNPGDNCYSVGSVEDVPFTVSGVREPEGERPQPLRGGQDPLSPAHASPGGCEVLLGPTRVPFAPQFSGAGRGTVIPAAAVGNSQSGERLRNPPPCPPSANGPRAWLHQTVRLLGWPQVCGGGRWNRWKPRASVSHLRPFRTCSGLGGAETRSCLLAERGGDAASGSPCPLC